MEQDYPCDVLGSSEGFAGGDSCVKRMPDEQRTDDPEALFEAVQERHQPRIVGCTFRCV